MCLPVWGLLATGWAFVLAIQQVQCANVGLPGQADMASMVRSRSLLNNKKQPEVEEDEDSEKVNLIIIPLMAFGAFMVFLCMRCCHWNQKDFRDRGIIIEHHHKKYIAKGLIHTTYDGNSRRRVSCVPEQLMLLPLFLTGSARSDLNKVMDPPTEGIVDKLVGDGDESSGSEPPSSDSEFDSPFPYQERDRRRSSSIPADYLGRFKKSRSNSLLLTTPSTTPRRVSVVSASPSAKSITHLHVPHTLTGAHKKPAAQTTMPPVVSMPNPHLANHLSVTAELHEPPRVLSNQTICSGDETPESVVYPLPGDLPVFPSVVTTKRDVSVETTYRDMSVDTGDLCSVLCAPVLHLDHTLHMAQNRKIAKARKGKLLETALIPTGRKRRRRQSQDEWNCSMIASIHLNYRILDAMHTSSSKTVNIFTPCLHDSGVCDQNANVVRLDDNTHSSNGSSDGQFSFPKPETGIYAAKPFIDYNPFEPVSTNVTSPNSSGHSFSDSDILSIHMPSLSISPLSSNSEFYKRLCSSEDSALAKSPVSELSTDERSARDTFSRDGTISPPAVGANGQIYTRALQHSKPFARLNRYTAPNGEGEDEGDDETMRTNQTPLTRVDSGKYSDVSTSSSACTYRYKRLSSSEPPTSRTVNSDTDENPLSQPLLQ